MVKKITFDDVYKDFRSHYPTLRKHAIGWQPYGYLSILVLLDDKIKVKYDYMRKQCEFVDT